MKDEFFLFPFKWETDQKVINYWDDTKNKAGSKTIDVINCFGLDKDNKTVCARIYDYKPKCYLELDDKIDWTDQNINNLINLINTECSMHYNKPEMMEHVKKYFHVDVNEEDYKDICKKYGKKYVVPEGAVINKKRDFLYLCFPSSKHLRGFKYFIEPYLKEVEASDVRQVKLTQEEEKKLEKYNNQPRAKEKARKYMLIKKARSCKEETSDEIEILESKVQSGELIKKEEIIHEKKEDKYGIPYEDVYTKCKYYKRGNKNSSIYSDHIDKYFDQEDLGEEDKFKLILHEHKIDHIVKFTGENNVATSGWNIVSKYENVKEKVSTCDIEIKLSAHNIMGTDKCHYVIKEIEFIE